MTVRWDGRAGWYEVWYVIVAGRFWLRHTIHVPTDPERDGTAALWLSSWTGAPTARKWSFPLDVFRTDRDGTRIEVAGARLDGGGAAGAVDDAAWELSFAGPGRPYAFPHPLARRLAKTRLEVTEPSLAVDGWVELHGERHELAGAAGHTAHVWGTRHADGFVWAHANPAPGRWVELLAARVPHLPVLGSHADERGAANAPWRLPFVRVELAPERSGIGPYAVAARREDFVGVTYEDPDGTPLFCYHTERARLSGPGVDAADVAYEFASRTPLEGWTISL